METKNIMIVGVGGQGSLLASKILGKAAMDSGCDVKVSEVHGMSQRGGKESIYSSSILAEIFRMALRENDVDENAVQLVENPDHALVSLLLQKNDEIDLVIPRGGERLIRAVVEQSKIPVIKHFNGICHVYIDKSADMEKPLAILL